MNLTTSQAYILLKSVTDTRNELVSKYKDDYFTDVNKLCEYLDELNVIIEEVKKEFRI